MTPLLASSSKTLDRLMLKARDSWAPRCFGSEGVRISMYTWLLSPSDFSPVGRLYLRLMSSSRYPVNNLDLATRSAIEVFLNTCNELYSSKLILSKTAIWQGFSQKTDMFCQPTHLVRLFERTACQVKWFISETPVGVHERTSMKEHLLWHGSEHKMQVRTTKRNKQQQNKRQQETREISLTKTKARVKNENRWVQQTHTLTHSYTRHAQSDRSSRLLFTAGHPDWHTLQVTQFGIHCGSSRLTNTAGHPVWHTLQVIQADRSSRMTYTEGHPECHTLQVIQNDIHCSSSRLTGHPGWHTLQVVQAAVHCRSSRSSRVD